MIIQVSYYLETANGKWSCNLQLQRSALSLGHSTKQNQTEQAQHEWNESHGGGPEDDDVLESWTPV